MSRKYKFRDQEKLYFITSTVTSWVDVFTRNEYKQIILDSFKHCQSKKGLIIHAWVLMSNHLHAIIRSDKTEKIESIVRDFKRFTAREICKAIENNPVESRKEWMLKIFSDEASKYSKESTYRFWIDGVHPVLLDTNELIEQKLNYTHNNPVKAGLVEQPDHYLFSSAIDYCGGKGLLDLVMIE